MTACVKWSAQCRECLHPVLTGRAACQDLMLSQVSFLWMEGSVAGSVMQAHTAQFGVHRARRLADVRGGSA